MSDEADGRNPVLTMTNVYWNEARHCYALAIVTEGKTRVFDFAARPQVFRLAAQAMNALTQHDAG
jgi:hypothetical protein